MASKNKAELIIEGTDKTGKAFASVDKKLSLTQKKSKALGLGFESLTKGTGKLTRGIGGLAGPAGITTLAILGLAATTTKAIASSIKYGDELDKTSKKLNITSEELQLYRRTLAFAGVESSTFEGALQFMEKSIGDVGIGTGRAKVAFEELGLSMSDLSGLDTIQKFELINSKLNLITDSTKRASLSTKIYSGFSQELNKILGENAAGFERSLVAVKETSNFLSNEATASLARAGDNVTAFTNKVKDLKNAFLNFSAPAIEKITELLSGGGGKSLLSRGIVADPFSTAVLSAEELSVAIETSTNNARELHARLLDIRKALANPLMSLGDRKEFEQITDKLQREFDIEIGAVDILKNAQAGRKGKDDPNLGTAGTLIPEGLFKSFDDLSQANASSLKEVMELRDGYEGIATTGVDALALLQRGASDNEIALQGNNDRIMKLQVNEERLTKIRKTLNTQTAEGAAAQTELSKSRDEADKQFLKNQQELIKEIEKGIDLENVKAEGIARTIKLTEELDQKTKESSVQFQAMGEAGKILFRDLNDGISEFIDGNVTLAEAFANMTTNILKDIAKMIAKFLVLISIALIFALLTRSSFSAGLSFAGNLGGVSGFDTKASGGPVSKGGSFLVGEKGPELFIPNNSGNITPNSQLGGGDVVVNNSFELINQSDTPLQGRMVSEQKADGEGEMVRIFITDLRNNGPMSRATATRFGLSSQPR